MHSRSRQILVRIPHFRVGRSKRRSSIWLLHRILQLLQRKCVLWIRLLWQF